MELESFPVTQLMRLDGPHDWPNSLGAARLSASEDGEWPGDLGERLPGGSAFESEAHFFDKVSLAHTQGA
jgi:hypothetical protein